MAEAGGPGERRQGGPSVEPQDHAGETDQRPKLHQLVRAGISGQNSGQISELRFSSRHDQQGYPPAKIIVATFTSHYGVVLLLYILQNSVMNMLTILPSKLAGATLTVLSKNIGVQTKLFSSENRDS